MSVALTILEQLGGNRFVAMTGAKSLVKGSDSLTFRLGRNKSKANLIQITLTEADEYDMTFYKLRGIDLQVVDAVSGLYVENLVECFENKTGLYTSL